MMELLFVIWLFVIGIDDSSCYKGTIFSGKLHKTKKPRYKRGFFVGFEAIIFLRQD
jgi:hypothetical protein